MLIKNTVFTRETRIRLRNIKNKKKRCTYARWYISSCEADLPFLWVLYHKQNKKSIAVTQKRHIDRRKKKILKSFSCCGFKFVSYSVISHSPSHFMLLLPLKSGGLTNLFQCAIMLVQIEIQRRIGSPLYLSNAHREVVNFCSVGIFILWCSLLGQVSVRLFNPGNVQPFAIWNW
jgi:hypothetical protein